MVGPIIVAAALALPLLMLLRRQIIRLRASARGLPWGWLLMATAVASTLGIYANQQPWSVTCDLRLIGFPAPMVFFHLEDGRWVDFVVPYPRFNLVVNVLVLGLVGTVGAALAARRGNKPLG